MEIKPARTVEEKYTEKRIGAHIDCEPALLSLAQKEKKGYEIPNTTIICTVFRLGTLQTG